MRKIPPQCYDLIKKFEGFQSKPYYCPAGLLTIGYGHQIKRGEALENITPVIAQGLLEDDVEDVGVALDTLIRVPLTDGQFSAILSFTYNIGIQALVLSCLLKELCAGHYGAVPDELMKWVHCKGVVLEGLKARREAEVKMWLS